MYCAKCGNKLQIGQNYCTHCGEPINQNTTESTNNKSFSYLIGGKKMRNNKIVLSGNINKVCQTTKAMLLLAISKGIKTMNDFLQDTNSVLLTKCLNDDYYMKCFSLGYKSADEDLKKIKRWSNGITQQTKC